MSTEFIQTEPHLLREEVVNFFFEQKHWSGAKTREDYYRMWDWRYNALSDGPPLVYIARNRATQTITGHIAVYRRRFRIGEIELMAGVPGNLLVHPAHRGGVAGPRLISFVRSLVRDGTVDLVIPFANAAAHQLFMRLGFRELGGMHTYVDIRKTAPILGRRLSAASVLGPVLDAPFSARRFIMQKSAFQEPADFKVREVSADEFETIDRSHWTHNPARMVAADSNRYVADRFLRCPYAPRRMFGLFDGSSLEGFVAVEGQTRLKIWNCQVNPVRLPEPMAISRVSDAIPKAETVIVPAMPNSLLAADLIAAGYFHTMPRDHIEKNTYISAHWLPNHPHAAIMENTARWNLWFGSNNY